VNPDARGPIVLYIAGFGRSGSTVLTNLLGEADGVFAAGEVLQFWRAMSTETCICGCGRAIKECSVWQGVRAACNVSEQEAGSLAKVAHELWRLRPLPAVALASRKRTRGRDFWNLHAYLVGLEHGARSDLAPPQPSPARALPTGAEKTSFAIRVRPRDWKGTQTACNTVQSA
jgi:hypothetical protein